jgi:hypothetical protein
MAKKLSKTFKRHFHALVPLAIAEWPDLSEANLLATEGDLDQAVNYISDATERTKTLVRRQLTELTGLIETKAEAVTTATPMEMAAAVLPGVEKASIDRLLDDLESRTEHLIQELKAEMLPELEQRARSNLGQSLLIALGLGFVLGLVVGGRRG